MDLDSQSLLSRVRLQPVYFVGALLEIEGARALTLFAEGPLAILPAHLQVVPGAFLFPQVTAGSSEKAFPRM